LHRVLDDYDEEFEAPLVTELLGEIAAARGDLDEAEARYREVLHRWPTLANTAGPAEVYLADVISQPGSADEEAVELLDRFLERSMPGRRWN
jgi:predicted Zn-dependent protease